MERDQPVQITHDALDRLLDRVIDLAKAEPAATVLEAWRVFERDVRIHFASEESRLLPAYARVEAAEVDALEQQHDLLRDRLRGLRRQLEARGPEHLRPEERQALTDLMALYKSHQRYEDRGVYRWARDQAD